MNAGKQLTGLVVVHPTVLSKVHVNVGNNAV